MNGKLVEWKDANIHIASHVIHYGSGVFEGARCYARRRARPASASTRTCAACRTRRRSTGWSIRSTSPAGTSAVLDTIRANAMKACYIRPIVYRGYDTLGVNPLANPVDAAIMVWEWGAYLGQDALEQGVDVKISSWSRMAPNTLPAMAKSYGQLRQLGADQDGSDRRRLHRGDRARRVRQRQRRQRPEHLRRARRRRSTRRRWPPRSSAASRATRS